MTQREIAARLVIAEYADADMEGSVDGWLKLSIYRAWEGAAVICAALDECERAK